MSGILDNMNKRMLKYVFAAFSVGLACTTARPAELKCVADDWVNICKQMPPDFRSWMIGANPTTGDLYVYADSRTWTTKLHVSKDQGSTWTEIPCPVSGPGGPRGFNLAYPFTGRMVLFTGDGDAGITLDGGASWKKFKIPPHSLQYGDIDWNSSSPKLMISNSWVQANGNALSPAISCDIGQTWTISSPMANVFGPNIKSGQAKVGIFDAKTVLMANRLSNGILISRDYGATWIKTANFDIVGSTPVHYGAHLYWVSSQGVIMTENGTDWKLLGTALPNIAWGPYFGKTESEIMVVTDAGVFTTRDAAKTWKKVSEFPRISINGRNIAANCFAWDSIHNLIYAIIGKEVWRLQVK
jgi:hypothetical protein